MILAHAKAWHIYNDRYKWMQKGKVIFKTEPYYKNKLKLKSNSSEILLVNC